MQRRVRCDKLKAFMLLRLYTQKVTKNTNMKPRKTLPIFTPLQPWLICVCEVGVLLGFLPVESCRNCSSSTVKWWFQMLSTMLSVCPLQLMI